MTNPTKGKRACTRPWTRCADHIRGWEFIAPPGAAIRIGNVDSWGRRRQSAAYHGFRTVRFNRAAQRRTRQQIEATCLAIPATTEDHAPPPQP